MLTQYHLLLMLTKLVTYQLQMKKLHIYIYTHTHTHTHTLSQRIKMYFVDFDFPSKDHGICDYSHI